MNKILINVVLVLLSSFSYASDDVELKKAPIDLNDQISLQRGARNFINYCLNCHSANYMRYNRLTDIGLTDELIKNNLLLILLYHLFIQLRMEVILNPY